MDSEPTFAAALAATAPLHSLAAKYQFRRAKLRGFSSYRLCEKQIAETSFGGLFLAEGKGFEPL